MPDVDKKEIEKYEAYARRAKFKRIRAAMPAPQMHSQCVHNGMVDYIGEYVEINGTLPRGKHTVRLRGEPGWGHQTGTWEVEFPLLDS